MPASPAHTDGHIHEDTELSPGTVRNWTANNGTSQIHFYGGGQANDTDHIENLRFTGITTFSHGHHARSGGGRDIFNFMDLNQVRNTIVGRLEDFDASHDRIQINGVTLNLQALPSNVRIVEFNGNHNDPGAQPQQWIHINTGSGNIFYALEGARVDMTGNGASNDGDQEGHFMSIGNLPAFSTLKAVAYVDPQNYVTAGVTPTSGGIIINDTDETAADVRAAISGSNGGDLIAAGLNDDTVRAGSGNDRVWGGSGNDMIYGDAGNDTLTGNNGKDILIGGSGRDVIYGNQDDDKINGGAGRDAVAGGSGRDLFEFRTGDLMDWDLIAGTTDQKNAGLDVITDFVIGTDRIEFENFAGVDSFADLMAYKTTINGNVYFTIQVLDTNEQLLVDVADNVSYSQFFNASNVLIL